MVKVQEFWDWFKLNEARYFFLGQVTDEIERERYLDELLEHLHLYCEQLYFEVGGAQEGNRDLIITAQADVRFFDDAELLVAHAPNLEHWNFIALKPATGEGVVKYGDARLDADLMYFDPLENKSSQKIGLRVYVENYNVADHDSFTAAAWILTDSLLGEKSSAMDIGYLEVVGLQPTSDKEKLIPFAKLPRYVDWKKSKANT